MKFKLDENLSDRCGVPLREAGYDVMSVPGQRMSGAPDSELIQACLVENRCLVTLDVGFGNPLVYNPSVYAGIAVLRVRGRPSQEGLRAAMSTLVAGLQDRPIAGELWIIQPGRIRVYQQE